MDAFYVVRKGDIIGVYKSLSDCQAQTGSSVIFLDFPLSSYNIDSCLSVSKALDVALFLLHVHLLVLVFRWIASWFLTKKTIWYGHAIIIFFLQIAMFLSPIYFWLWFLVLLLMYPFGSSCWVIVLHSLYQAL